MTAVYTLLKSIKFKQLKSLIGLFIKRPLMIYPSIKATVNCIRISNSLYPGLHHINNKTNAFRHALWNMLLVKDALVWNRSIIRALAWAKRFTEWHEDFSPNPPLERAMDLHNNEFGRRLMERIFQKQAPTMSTILKVLQEELVKSKKVTKPDQILLYKNNLVYIHD